MASHKLIFLVAATSIIAGSAAEAQSLDSAGLAQVLLNRNIPDSVIARRVAKTDCVRFVPTMRRVQAVIGDRPVTGELNQALRKPCLVSVEITESSSVAELAALLDVYGGSLGGHYINQFLVGCPRGLERKSLNELAKKKLPTREFKDIADRCNVGYLGPRVSLEAEAAISPLITVGSIRQEGFTFQGMDAFTFRASVRTFDELHAMIWWAETEMSHDHRRIDLVPGGDFLFHERGASARWMVLCRFGRVCSSPVARRFEPFLESGISWFRMRGHIQGQQAAATAMKFRGRTFLARAGLLAYTHPRFTIAGSGGIGVVQFKEAIKILPDANDIDHITAWSLRPQAGLQLLVHTW